ncbi:MAG TPA: hypothetical protein DDX40_02870 [Rikenellaceae bacterium]|nr:hypothetical protein [Rikenellaceae bacterium]
MKKVLVSLISALAVALLGVIGLNIFKNASPRERVKAEDGSNIIVEELSFYKHNDKIFGKVFKPADKNGFFPDSLGARPVIIYFHEPLKTAFPDNLVKSLVPEGLIGYTTAFHENGKDVGFMVKKIGKERFADAERIVLIADTFSSEAVVKAAYKLKKAVNGIVLIEPEPDEKVSRIVPKLGYEVLTIDSAGKTSARAAILDYLELRGMLK